VEQPIKSKKAMSDQSLEQVNSFTFLGCKLTLWAEKIYRLEDYTI